jgi:hypothetical protein
VVVELALSDRTLKAVSAALVVLEFLRLLLARQLLGLAVVVVEPLVQGQQRRVALAVAVMVLPQTLSHLHLELLTQVVVAELAHDSQLAQEWLRQMVDQVLSLFATQASMLLQMAQV